MPRRRCLHVSLAQALRVVASPLHSAERGDAENGSARVQPFRRVSPENAWRPSLRRPALLPGCSPGNVDGSFVRAVGRLQPHCRASRAIVHLMQLEPDGLELTLDRLSDGPRGGPLQHTRSLDRRQDRGESRAVQHMVRPVARRAPPRTRRAENGSHQRLVHSPRRRGDQRRNPVDFWKEANGGHFPPAISRAGH